MGSKGWIMDSSQDDKNLKILWSQSDVLMTRISNDACSVVRNHVIALKVAMFTSITKHFGNLEVSSSIHFQHFSTEVNWVASQILILAEDHLKANCGPSSPPVFPDLQHSSRTVQIQVILTTTQKLPAQDMVLGLRRIDDRSPKCHFRCHGRMVSDAVRCTHFERTRHSG